MRIGYFADGPWSHLALEKMRSDERFDVCFIVPRFETQDSVLRRWADRLSVDFLPLLNVNSPESLAALGGYHADLFVSMSFDQIFKKSILALPPLGIINCHAGALPFYRGRNVLNWALINDASEFGITVHHVNEGIDTGDIIEQRTEPISDADTYQTLLERATVACAETLHAALGKISDGTVTRLSQSNVHPVGSYSGRRIVGDEWIDWSWPSRRIFNFVRAITEPGPCARTLLDGNVIVVQRASLIPEAPEYLGTPGEIVGVPGSGVVVKTGDTTILLEQPSAQTPVHFRVGMRFRSSRDAEIAELKARIEVLEESISGLPGTKERGSS